MARLGDLLQRPSRTLIGAPPPRKSSPYDTLDPPRIVETADILSRRVKERFPSSGLLQVCDHLVDVARDAHQTATWIGRPLVGLRMLTGGLAGLIVVGVVVTILAVEGRAAALGFVDYVGALEAGINDIVLIGAAIFFLVTLETRIKRNRALQALHKLRSLAHIIDMHQLTKSPERVLFSHPRTTSSPRTVLTPFELNRYLDYCTEMLSLTGKVAALYIQDFDDSVALGAVNEIETLTTGLSRKIWQKLMILQDAVSPRRSVGLD